MTSPIAKKLDKLADRHGIAPRHVARNPELLATIGLDPEDIGDDVVREATEYGEHMVRQIAVKHGISFTNI